MTFLSLQLVSLQSQRQMNILVCSSLQIYTSFDVVLIHMAPKISTLEISIKNIPLKQTGNLKSIQKMKIANISTLLQSCYNKVQLYCTLAITA